MRVPHLVCSAPSSCPTRVRCAATMDQELSPAGTTVGTSSLLVPLPARTRAPDKLGSPEGILRTGPYGSRAPQSRRGARRSAIALLGLFVFLLGGPGLPAEDLPETARQILDKVDDLYRGESSRGRATMTITTAHWTRTLTMSFWSLGKEKTLIRILAPKKEKGTATLRRDKDIWNYLPKIKRVIKVPTSMMSSSWMGSHFTNDDLVKETRMADDYTFELGFQGERDGQKVIEVACTPKEDAPVVWGKVVVTVREPDYLPVQFRYYDEDLELTRRLTFSDFRSLGGREMPVKLSMEPLDKPKESTVIIYEDLEFDELKDDKFFTLRELQR